MSTPNMPLEHEVAETILVAHVALEKAAAAHQAATELQAACQALIPEIADQAVKSAAIEPHEKNDFANALANPVKALQLLKFALDQRTSNSNVPAREVDRNGRPATKTANENRKRNNYIGSGVPSEAANAAFDEALGIGS